MPAPLLYDIIESPSHPDLSGLVQRLGFERLAFTAQRKALASLKRRPPDVLVADFFYGWGNNYAGANVSNLDVLLRSLQRFAPQARVVILADANEAPHVERLGALFTLDAVVRLPASEADIAAALTAPQH